MTIPIIQAATDLTGHAGKQVQVCGLYGVQELGGYSIKIKAADGSWKRVRRIAFLKLQDGSFINAV
ncbi:MAG: hypothetical protein JSW39_21110 [Desulfobacterales bacterium]|nr:MAG: hypothetical protein JSW39_21110 [Desulfobacterales bacterium]